ncbi:hypothetical protein FOL47_009900 [Perkinsus chesapeaki]|uniref:LITAF domain-containing protein n=1 Tax=Perkinsus chesapeaki TaxID=330153 RepID=A0A7J6MQY6_PERCH|nr:hypothetical protein FOL47_009900 [Perkinsus chesapeaki]
MDKEDTKPATAQPAVIGHPVEARAGPPPPAAVVFMPDFGDDPVTLDCPNCRHKIISNVSHESKCVWLYSAVCGVEDHAPRHAIALFKSNGMSWHYLMVNAQTVNGKTVYDRAKADHIL